MIQNDEDSEFLNNSFEASFTRTTPLLAYLFWPPLSLAMFMKRYKL